MNARRRRLDTLRIARLRAVVQLGSFALLVYGGAAALTLGNYLPTFACPFDEQRGGTCGLFAFQHMANLPLDQLLGRRGLALLLGLATFAVLAVLLNKAWCGFVCPLGALQDAASWLRQRLRLPYAVYSAARKRRLGTVKWVLLGLLFALPFAMSNSIFGLPRLSHDFATPYCQMCPARTTLPLFAGDVGELAVDFSSPVRAALTGLGAGVTGVFLVGAFWKRRFFCLFCPMSALLHLLSRAGLLQLVKDGSRCTRCGNCYRACSVGIPEIADDVTSRRIAKEDCMMCLECVDSCPEDGCLEARFAGLPLLRSTAHGFFHRAARRKRHGR